jgi:hypothetical protein
MATGCRLRPQPAPQLSRYTAEPDETVGGWGDRPWHRGYRHDGGLVALRDAIKRAYIEVLEKISERTRAASPAATGGPPELAATGHAYAPLAEP